MKQIIFTIMKGSWTFNVSTKSLLADEEDQLIKVMPSAPAAAGGKSLFQVMSELTTKYNERNIAVLFEID